MADPSLSLRYRIVLPEKFNKPAIPIFSTTSTFAENRPILRDLCPFHNIKRLKEIHNSVTWANTLFDYPFFILQI